MNAQVSSHATVELLSAYLDRELVEPEARELEAHLEECRECHVRLQGLRQVVSNLHRLESVEPSPELEQAVARRVALAGEPLSVLDRVENRLSIFNRQSSILPMFGVVLALVVFVYLFAVALDQSRRGLIPVVFEDPATAAAGEEAGAADRSELAGRLFLLRDGAWVEEGVSPEAVSRTLTVDSEAGRELLAAHPELEELARLQDPVILELDGEVIEIR